MNKHIKQNYLKFRSVGAHGMKEHINWHSFTEIQKHLGQVWIDRHLKKQGWMTGCWVDCDGGAK